MPTIPNWLTGPGGTIACVLTPQTNTAGVLADTTPVQTLTGSLDSVRPASQARNENITAMNTVLENNVQIEVGTRITLVEILKNSGTNMLAQFAYGNTAYAKVVLSRGAQVFTYYGIIASYEEGIEKGKSVGTLTLDPVGVALGYA